jgi:hypothetical protein
MKRAPRGPFREVTRLVMELGTEISNRPNMLAARVTMTRATNPRTHGLWSAEPSSPPVEAATRPMVE